MRIGGLWKRNLLGICLIDSASLARVEPTKGGGIFPMMPSTEAI